MPTVCYEWPPNKPTGTPRTQQGLQCVVSGRQINLQELLEHNKAGIVMGSRGQGYRNCQRMAINTLIQQLCRKRKLDLWGCFVGRADMYMKDGLHLSGKGAAVFADGLTAAVDSGIGSITNIFGSKHCVN